FYFQAEDGIRDWSVTGVQTCALPISRGPHGLRGGEDRASRERRALGAAGRGAHPQRSGAEAGGRQGGWPRGALLADAGRAGVREIGRASCRERVESSVGVEAWR